MPRSTDGLLNELDRKIVEGIQSVEEGRYILWGWEVSETSNCTTLIFTDKKGVGKLCMDISIYPYNEGE